MKKLYTFIATMLLMGSTFAQVLVNETFENGNILYNDPKEIKSLYIKQNPDGKTVAGASILVPK